MNIFQKFMNKYFEWEYIAYKEYPDHRPNEWTVCRLYNSNAGKYIKEDYGRLIFIEIMNEKNWKIL